MEALKEYARFKKRLAFEGVFKALLIGLLTAGVSALITCVVCWYLGFNALWIVLPELVVISGVVFCLLYFFKYRTTAKRVAARVDELGLEERMITMCEYQGDQSFMANAQRQDALNALSTVNKDMIPMAISNVLIVFTALAVTCCAIASEITVLTSDGVIKSGQVIVEKYLERPAEKFSVRYSSGLYGTLYCPSFNAESNEEIKNELLANGYAENESGSIKLYSDGSVEMTFTEGEDGDYIFAIPKAGYVFVQWSDGELSPFRKDAGLGIYSEISAIYEEGDFDMESYLRQLEAAIPSLSDSSNKPYDNERSSDSNNSNSTNSPNSGDYSGGVSGGFIIDGKTDYRHVYKDYADSGLDRVNNDTSMNERLIKAINNYYNAIKASSPDDADN